MSASTEPTGDAELARLVYALIDWTARNAADPHPSAPRSPATRDWLDGIRGAADVLAATSSLLHHIDTQYVRRDRLVPDEWDDLDATAESED